MSALREAALLYAAQWSLAVFPLIAELKEPAIARGFYAATTNPETIKRYWRVPDRNVAIATGAVSAVWVVDIDDRQGESSLADLELEYGPLPPTWELVTGKGRHVWFRYSTPIPSSTGHIATAIDVRADSAYAVAAPSIHPNGATYRWSIPPDGEPAEAPEWLVGLARKRPVPSIAERAVAAVHHRHGADRHDGRYGAAALDREISALADVGPGGRNHAANWASFRLHQLVAGGELDHHDVVERLIGACHRNGLIHDDGIRQRYSYDRSGANAGMHFPRSRVGHETTLRPYQTYCPPSAHMRQI